MGSAAACGLRLQAALNLVQLMALRDALSAFFLYSLKVHSWLQRARAAQSVFSLGPFGRLGRRGGSAFGQQASSWAAGCWSAACPPRTRYLESRRPALQSRSTGKVGRKVGCPSSESGPAPKPAEDPAAIHCPLFQHHQASRSPVLC